MSELENSDSLPEGKEDRKAVARFLAQARVTGRAVMICERTYKNIRGRGAAIERTGAGAGKGNDREGREH